MESQSANLLTVVTPAFLEKKKTLLRNLSSVQHQVSSSTHDAYWCSEQLIIWDGVTNLRAENTLLSVVGEEGCLKVRYNHDDYGDYIRRLGTRLAIKQNSNAVTYLDADNYWSPNHWATVNLTRASSQKNIIISGRKLLHENGKETEDFTKDFFDTNTITLFGDAKKIGLLWGLYPREMSLVGDRIISKYIQTHFSNEIAFTNEATVNYSYSPISKEKVAAFKTWYRDNYAQISDTFRRRFGFDLLI